MPNPSRLKALCFPPEPYCTETYRTCLDTRIGKYVNFQPTFNPRMFAGKTCKNAQVVTNL